MKIPFIQLSRSRKIENAVFVLIILFIYKIIFPSIESLPLLLINEILVLFSIYFLILYVIEILHERTVPPLSIVLNAGILNAVLFFIISISSVIFAGSSSLNEGTDFIITILLTLISFVFIGALTYIFSVFRELFFLRQKKDPRTYFNTMMFFILLATFSNSLARIDASIEYIHNTFYVVSIVLISLNSIRVAWIAFLPKKQKVYLLIISIILSTLFALNFIMLESGGFISSAVLGFSPGLLTFLNLIMLYGMIYFGVIFFTTLFHLPTAEAFDRKSEEVSSLMDLSKLITQVFDFKELADTVTKTTTSVCNSDAAWLVTVKNGEAVLSSICNIGYIEADMLNSLLKLDELKESDGVFTLDSGTIRNNNLNISDRINFKSIVIAPLKVHDSVNGYLFTARKEDFGFDEDDRKSIVAFADYAAVALENAKHIEESIEKERLEKELDVAREIQYKILPSVTPECKELDISALFIPAFEVGGDYYDFFKLNETKLGFIIADVSGKGITAAFVMAELKGIFESLSKLIESPKKLLIMVNEILKDSLDKKTFVTAVYGVIDLEKRKLTFARSGHTPVHLLRDGKIERLIPGGIGLGLDYGRKFSETLKEMEINLNNDDIIILYTDGIPESQNAEYKDFGLDKLDSIIKNNAGKNIKEISNEIMKKVSVYSQDKAQHDDITLVIFKWKFSN